MICSHPGWWAGARMISRAAPEGELFLPDEVREHPAGAGWGQAYHSWCPWHDRPWVDCDCTEPWGDEGDEGA